MKIIKDRLIFKANKNKKSKMMILKEGLFQKKIKNKIRSYMMRR